MTDGREDINDVLNEVITKINRITDHLRGSGENEAANHFTREMTRIFRDLYNVIAPWDIEKCLMSPPSTADPTANRPQQSVRHVSGASASTWASIAAIEPVADKNGIIKFRPNDAVRCVVTPTKEPGVEGDAQERRVLWISSWPEARPLSDVSKSMSDAGAVYSMTYVLKEQAVCVIFQKASCAHDFLQRCADHYGHSGTNLFGGESCVFPGIPFAMNDDIGRMDSPYNERRRLTFARSQLFCNGVNETKFRHEIEEMVGAQNVELLWLFNTGNATVVFSAVPLARTVREKFLQYSHIRKHAYEGIMVSYSHDPCERELHLVSQIPGHANFIGSNSSGKDQAAGGRANRSYTLSMATTAALSPLRRISAASTEYQHEAKHRRTASLSIDDDGWQTVHKKKR